MDTVQITRLLARDARTRSIFRGVVPKDGLPTTIEAFPATFVCNSHDGDEPGEHYYYYYHLYRALYVDADTRSDYFCSYGLLPLHVTFRAFPNEHCSEWTNNVKRLQNPLSSVCRQYCVAYLLLRCNSFPMRTFANIFGTDLVANDCCMFD